MPVHRLALAAVSVTRELVLMMAERRGEQCGQCELSPGQCNTECSAVIPAC